MLVSFSSCKRRSNLNLCAICSRHGGTRPSFYRYVSVYFPPATVPRTLHNHLPRSVTIGSLKGQHFKYFYITTNMKEAFENLMVEHLGKKSPEFHEAWNFGLHARKIPRLHLPYQVNSSPQFHTVFLRNSFSQTQSLARYFSRQVFKLTFYINVLIIKEVNVFWLIQVANRKHPVAIHECETWPFTIMVVFNIMIMKRTFMSKLRNNRRMNKIT